MSDEHMATAREVTRDWTPQTTLADSRRDIANALAAAEERGRLQGQFSPLGDNHHNAAACPHCGDLLTNAEERGRRAGIEERDREWLVAVNQSEDGRYSEALKDLLSAALAPRDSGKEDRK